MGGFGLPFLPPTQGFNSLEEKFGRGAKKVGNAVGSLGASLADAGRAAINGPGVDLAPDNEPSKSAVQVKAPRADIQSASGYLAPNAPASSLREKYGSERGPVTPSVVAHAYQEQPGFGEFGSSGPRSLAQTLQDREAAAQIDQSYGARMKSNEDFAQHPQEDALRAKTLTAGYEDLMEAPQSLYAKFNGKGEMTAPGSFYQESNGAYTNSAPGIRVGQQRAIEAAYAKQVGPEQERRGSFLGASRQEESARLAAIQAIDQNPALAPEDKAKRKQEVEARAAQRMSDLEKAFGLGAKLSANELYK